MKNLSKNIARKKNLILFVLIAQMQLVFSTDFVSGYNYVQINTDNLDNLLNLSPPSSTTTDNETKYIYTLANCSKFIYEQYMNPATSTSNTTPPLNSYIYPASNTSYITRNGLRFYKTKYCTQHLSNSNLDLNFRMLIIRPDDNTTRKCILITNSALDQLNTNTYMMYPLLIDWALRGYCVVFYENVTSSSFVNRYLSSNGSPGSIGYPAYVFRYLCANSAPFGVANLFACGIANSVFPAVSEEQFSLKNAYWAFQQGVAAYNYITQSGNPYNINNNEIYTYGISQGAQTAFFLNYARPSVNFLNNSNYYNFYNTSPNITTFTGNDYLKISKYNNTSYNVKIKSSALIALSYPTSNTSNTAYAGNFFQQPGFKKVSSIMCYGSSDPIMDLDGLINDPNNNTDGPKQLKPALTNLNVTSKIIVNCSGEHMFPTKADNLYDNKAYDANYDIFSASSINDQRLYRFKYMMQQYSDLNKYVSDSFYIPYGDTNYTHLDNRFYSPINTYSSLGTANGHFTNSTSCAGISSTNPYRMSNQSLKEIMNSEFSLYPNPTTNKLYIKSNEFIDKKLNVYIYNLLGALVYAKENLIAADSEINIDMLNLPNGIYNLAIDIDNNRIVKSIVINSHY